ncbi:MAG: DUF2079 domain-containing protein, partial [Chloroflexi bacterium]|nr:DUF2079 domain-containing protein [Chloroflexota bacterium]
MTFIPLAADALLGASGGLAAYLLARKRLGNSWLALPFLLAYLLHPVQQWIQFGIRPAAPLLINLFPALLMLALLALEHRWRAAALVCAALAALSSDLGAVTLAMLGLYWGAARPAERGAGLTMAMLGVAGALATAAFGLTLSGAPAQLGALLGAAGALAQSGDL